MRRITFSVVTVVNLPREGCNLLIGKEHKTSHRMIAGMVVMGAGVLLAKTGHYMPYEGMAVAVDMTGYFVHALGATPYLEWLLASEAAA
jgi:hypothetical protein